MGSVGQQRLGRKWMTGRVVRAGVSTQVQLGQRGGRFLVNRWRFVRLLVSRRRRVKAT